MVEDLKETKHNGTDNVKTPFSLLREREFNASHPFPFYIFSLLSSMFVFSCLPSDYKHQRGWSRLLRSLHFPPSHQFFLPPRPWPAPLSIIVDVVETGLLVFTMVYAAAFMTGMVVFN